jgi:hypothetical protein
MKEKRKFNKKGQLAIFIIIAIIIVVALVILLLFKEDIQQVVSPTGTQEYIKECTETAALEALEKVEEQGGSINPENYLLYEDKEIEYICYTEDYYSRCVMQKPFLKQSIEQEIASYAEPKVRECFRSMESRLESSGSDVKVNEVKVETSLIPNNIIVTIKAPTTITREGSISFENFRTNVKSEIYDLTMLASSISNFEARYGDSDTLTYMMYYPDIKVEKIERESGSRVYILTHKPSQEKFSFASRSIAWPAGYLGIDENEL